MAAEQVDAVISLVEKMGVEGEAEEKAPPARELPSVEERLRLIHEVIEEVVGEEDLKKLLTNTSEKFTPRAYDGFEPSGRMHLAQGVLKSIIVNRLAECGIDFVFLVADSFALLNNKMGGKMDRIRVCGEYFVEVWKATGMNLDRVSFEWSSEVTTRPEYWSMVQDMATRFSVKRISRCCTALGRTEADDMSSAQIMYPLMQGVDPFILGVQIAQLGGDQRKVTMLSREYAGISAVKKARKIRPPVIMHHHMLMGLKEGASKMSKSIPDTAIFMEDTEADVKRKIKKAFCPPGQVADNPVLDLFKWIVFLKYSSVTVQTESGEEREYTTYAELEADYAAGKLHPSHLKPALIAKINEILQPVRDHFASGRPAELLKKVRSYKATR